MLYFNGKNLVDVYTYVCLYFTELFRPVYSEIILLLNTIVIRIKCILFKLEQTNRTIDIKTTANTKIGCHKRIICFSANHPLQRTVELILYFV